MWKVLVSLAKKIFQIFMVLDCLYLKNDKRIRLSRGIAVRVLDEICIDDISAVALNYRTEIFATLHHLGWIDAPNSQHFEIL
jgi:hypothetical protein